MVQNKSRPPHSLKILSKLYVNMISFPLSIRFKLLAWDSTIYLQDHSGKEILFLKKAPFRLREKISIYTDSTKQTKRWTISTSQIIDLGATYEVFDEEKQQVAFRIKHSGWSFLWRTRYTILDLQNNPIAEIKEDNPWIEVLNAFLEEVPYLGILSIWLFHPTYTLKDKHGVPVLILKKKPSLFERRFTVEQGQDSSLLEEDAAIVSVLLTVTFRRSQG